jgi:hypothetical protein
LALAEGAARGVAAQLTCAHGAVARSVEEAGDHLFTFTRPPPRPERARITNAIESPHAEFKRCIKTQTAPPPADTTAVLFWGLIASDCLAQGRRDGKRWQPNLPISRLTRRLDQITSPYRRPRHANSNTILDGTAASTHERFERRSGNSEPSRGLPCSIGRLQGMHIGQAGRTKWRAVWQSIDFGWDRKSSSVAAIRIVRRPTASMRSFANFRMPMASFTTESGARVNPTSGSSRKVTSRRLRALLGKGLLCVLKTLST